jgi:hypothetical protein
LKPEIDFLEYSQKRYEIVKDLTTSAMSAPEILKGETKTLESLIYNSIQIADNILAELYVSKIRQSSGDEPSIHNISDILNKTDK